MKMKLKKMIALVISVLSVCVMASSAFAYVSSPTHKQPTGRNKGVKDGPTPSMSITEEELEDDEDAENMDDGAGLDGEGDEIDDSVIYGG